MGLKKKPALNIIQILRTNKKTQHFLYSRLSLKSGQRRRFDVFNHNRTDINN